MVEDIDPHIIGITESWANTDITDAELGLRGYVMFRRDRIGRRGGGVILYVKESIQQFLFLIQDVLEPTRVKCIRVQGVMTNNFYF